MDRSLPALLVSLLVAAACGGEPSCPAHSRAEDGRCVPLDAGPDAGPDASADGGETDAGERDAGEPDAGPCGGACSGALPVCDEARGECVECTGDEHCTEGRCDTDAGACVECVEGADCTDPAAARCEAGACVACAESADCAHLSGLGVCDGGECVECTASDAGACGGHLCRPDRTCSDYGGAQQTCEPCDTDSNCSSAHDYCVPMTYAGAGRGGYCLTDADEAGGCERPYSITLDGRTTLSGRAGGRYCGIHEELASCEAVRALLDDWRCTGTDGRCSPAVGEPEVEVPGALCRTVGTLANRCTYGCSGAASECLDPPTAGSTCGPGTSGGADYCGG